MDYHIDEGYERLWRWFGLSRASWLTIPRVLMHEMSDEWQEKMAQLLEEYDRTWKMDLDVDSYVQLRKDGKFIKTPEWMLNYRHPSPYVNTIKNKRHVIYLKIDQLNYKEKIYDSIENPFYNFNVFGEIFNDKLSSEWQSVFDEYSKDVSFRYNDLYMLKEKHIIWYWFKRQAPDSLITDITEDCVLTIENAEEI